MDLLKIQLEGRYLGRDIFLFIFYSDSTAFSSTKYVREFRIRDFMLNAYHADSKKPTIKRAFYSIFLSYQP